MEIVEKNSDQLDLKWLYIDLTSKKKVDGRRSQIFSPLIAYLLK